MLEYAYQRPGMKQTALSKHIQLYLNRDGSTQNGGDSPKRKCLEFADQASDGSVGTLKLDRKEGRGCLRYRLTEVNLR
jgi:hypothetical protein